MPPGPGTRGPSRPPRHSQLKVLLRLCHDVKAFPNLNAFEHAIGQMTEIAKQNQGLLKGQRQGHSQSRRAMREAPASSRAARPS